MHWICAAWPSSSRDITYMPQQRAHVLAWPQGSVTLSGARWNVWKQTQHLRAMLADAVLRLASTLLLFCTETGHKHRGHTEAYGCISCGASPQVLPIWLDIVSDIALELLTWVSTC